MRENPNEEVISDPEDLQVQLMPLEWGNHQQIVDSLALMPNDRPDLLLACEVLHIPIFDLYAEDMLSPLLDTILLLTGENTTIILGQL